jgi:integrase
MSVKIRKKNGKLYLDIYQSGKRTWEALHLTLSPDKEQNREVLRLAEICRSKKETQLLAGSWDLQDPVAGKKKLTDYLAALAKTKEHTDYITGCIRYLNRYPGGASITLSQISPQWVDNYQRYLAKETKLSASSSYNYSKAVRMALRQAVKDNILIKNPADTVKGLPEPETDLVFLSPEEVKQLSNTDLSGDLGAEVRRAFLFICHTGLRISDIKELKWGDIQPEPLQIIKRQKKTKRMAVIPLLKEGAGRWVDLDGAYTHSPDDLVFPLLASKIQTNRYLIKWAAAAGIAKPIGWHTARRTFATRLLEAGTEIYTVANLLGHKGLKQVSRYAQVTDKLRQTAIAKLS